MFKLYNNLMAPIDSGSGNSNTSDDLTKDGILDILNEEDEAPEPIKIDKPVKKDEPLTDDEDADVKPDDDKSDKDEDEEEEVDELKELEDELKEPDPEKLELQTPVRRKEILAKYPKLFKDFPYLETAYYRDLKFTEIVPTIDDAKEAVAKASALDAFEEDLNQGNTEKVLTGIKRENPNAFAKIADNYLETLSKVDRPAYHHVIGNMMKNTIIAMVNEAEESNNQALTSAATILHQFIFGSSKFTPPTKLSVENPETDKDKQVSEREQKFNRERFNGAQTELTTTVNNRLKATIETNLDPKKTMTDYVRKNATRDAMEKVEELVKQDGRFRTLLDKLWINAFKSDYSKDSLDKIRSAYFTKAKTLLPAVIKSARNEALKGMGKRIKSDDTDDTTDETTINESKKTGTTRESAPHRSGGKIKSAKDIPAGMTTAEYLAMD